MTGYRVLYDRSGNCFLFPQTVPSIFCNRGFDSLISLFLLRLVPRKNLSSGNTQSYECSGAYFMPVLPALQNRGFPCFLLSVRTEIFLQQQPYCLLLHCQSPLFRERMKTAGGFQDISPSINHPYGQPHVDRYFFYRVMNETFLFMNIISFNAFHRSDQDRHACRFPPFYIVLFST